MLQTEQFGQLLKDRGFTFFSGVPCSFLKDLINYAVNECEYVMAANEGDAVSICAGASLAGKKTIVLMQNSGLGNAISPLTSLNAVFKIPVLGFVSLRGETGIPDEPQHELMGVITDTMLDTIKIAHAVLSTDINQAKKQVSEALAYINQGKPFFFIIKKETFSKIQLKNKTDYLSEKKLPKRADLLSIIVKSCSENTAFIATTGFTGRELYQLHDTINNFYMVGSLGCASSIGLGICLAKPEQKVVVFDGDGSALMRMGSYAVNAFYKPAYFCHILFDNNAHESTGGQCTVSENIDYPNLARACGYTTVLTARTETEAAECMKKWKIQGGCCFLYIRIMQGTFENLVRPKIKPDEVTKRFSAFLNNTVYTQEK